MKYWLAAIGFVISGAAMAQQMTATLPSTPDADSPSVLPLARRAHPPVAALLQSRSHEIFLTTCAACHGTSLQPGPAAKSLFSKAVLDGNTDTQIIGKITNGVPGSAKPHAYVTSFSADEISQIPVYLRIRGGIMNRKIGPVPDPAGKLFKTDKATFKVEVLAKGFNQPWGMAWTPDGTMLFTERSGNLRLLNRNGKVSEPVKNTPKAFERQDGGMLDVAVAPDYATSGWVYLAYSTTLPGYVPQPADFIPVNLSPLSMTVIVRGKINANHEWVDEQVLFKASDEIYNNWSGHYGARFLFDRNGHVFWTMGDRQDPQSSQNLASPLGKIHRINLDGSIPKDNPFVNTAGALPSIWSYGHRHPEGIAFDPVTGILWETEHGPVGGDEVNIIEPGRNYGWGVVTMGLEPGVNRQHAVGMTPPITHYTPSIGPGGNNFYTGHRFPGWKNNLFIAGMVGQKLIRLEIKGRQIVGQEEILKDHGRLREVKTGPDGHLYMLLQTQNGAATGGSIIRLVPAN